MASISTPVSTQQGSTKELSRSISDEETAE